jgi:lipopolysaccharide transport system ATP-binding protein
MSNIIEIRDLSKKYSLQETQQYIALRDVLSNAAKNIFSSKPGKKEFYALQNINLDIEKGERVGIIGRNGAGKSTLLKILSRITPPTTGSVKLRGRVGSLLEVGTGFHPELTGRENIYLNGSILGLKKKEINTKLDEIIDFSGVEKFIDTPLKHYSSGMQMRLAFSVAAHLESEILLIDEVLAVGDIEFQKKCMGKMEEVSKSEGRTILFVSHNLKAINDLCTKTTLMESGKVLSFDTTKNIVDLYVNSFAVTKPNKQIRKENINGVGIIELTTCSDNHTPKYYFSPAEKIGVRIKIYNADWKKDFTIGFAVNETTRGRVMISLKKNPPMPERSEKEFIAWLPPCYLTPNTYSVDISIMGSNNELIIILKEDIGFEIGIANTKFESIQYDYGILAKEPDWEDIL